MSNQNHKLLLLKGIALLYRESKLIENNDNSADLLKRIIKEAVAPDMVIGHSIDNEVSAGLKKIAGFMVENAASHQYDDNTLRTEVRMACANDESISPIIDAYFEEITDSDRLKLTVLNLRKSLQQHFNEKDLETLLTKASIRFKTDRDNIPSVRTFLAELVGKLEPHTVSTEAKDPAINCSINLSDVAAAENLVERIQLQEDGTHILQTGWQGINRMLDGGFRPGEQWVIGAMEHNWKTGFSLSIFRQLAVYNDAVAIRGGSRKPALVRFSFDDSAEANMQFLYKSLWENESGEVLVEFPKDAKEVAAYITERMTRRGWEVFLYDVNPSMWTYKDICNEILRLEARGYEVRVCMLDYLLKVPTTGCDPGPHGVDIRNLYERIKAFMAARKIIMITPHQLSPDAKMKAREGTLNFVKEMRGGGYYSGTKQLGQVIDGEIFIHIEFDGKGRAYLTIQRGKHRKINQTEAGALYAVLAFVAGGVIPDDVNKNDSTRTKVGGDTLGSISDAAVAELMF